jgi:hypothetical protein
VVSFRRASPRCSIGKSMSELRIEKRVLIRPASDVHAAIVRAARGRHITRTEFIEKLLAVIVRDHLIDALLDDDRELKSN